MQQSLTHLALLAGAGLGCGYAAIQIGLALLARRWPTVEGEIVDARVVRTGDGQDTRAIDRVVTYRYQVAGRPYTNNRVRFGLQPTPSSMVPVLGTSSNVVPGLTADYPRGKPVRVHYNPRRPEDSVLYPTPNFRVWIVLAAALYCWYAVL